MKTEWNDSVSSSLSDSGIGWNLASMSWTECAGSVTDRLGTSSLGSRSSLVSLNGISSDVVESRCGTLAVVVETLSSVVSPSYASIMSLC